MPPNQDYLMGGKVHTLVLEKKNHSWIVEEEKPTDSNFYLHILFRYYFAVLFHRIFVQTSVLNALLRAAKRSIIWGSSKFESICGCRMRRYPQQGWEFPGFIQISTGNSGGISFPQNYLV
jgi:hypothetical protein